MCLMSMAACEANPSRGAAPKPSNFPTSVRPDSLLSTTGDRDRAQRLAERDLTPGQVGYVAPARAVEGTEFRVKAVVAPGATGLAGAIKDGRLNGFDDPVL